MDPVSGPYHRFGRRWDDGLPAMGHAHGVATQVIVSIAGRVAPVPGIALRGQGGLDRGRGIAKGIGID